MALPEYDPDTDGNRYGWILDAVRQVRAERQARSAGRQLFNPGEAEAIRAFDAAIDTDDANRLQGLRDKYNLSRSRTTKKVA